MKKRMLIMVAVVIVVFGSIFGVKAVKAKMTQKYMSFKQPPATITALKATFQPWQPQLKAVGSLRAYRGVDVTSEIAGLVREVKFRSGQQVDEGQVLVLLNADADIAQLHALEAAANLARTTLERDKKQFAVQTVSQATVDAEEADLSSKNAQVEQQRALVDKKTIRAPFSGRLGISTINPGQYMNPGDKIVTLQELNPLYVDFYLPQQELARAANGQAVSITTDSFPGRVFQGKIKAINPKVDPDTRNFQAEALISNTGGVLLPGMYATVDVRAGSVQRYLTVPQTAITYNPYGNTVFIVKEQGTGPDNKAQLIAQQVFVTVGPTRGDQVAVLSGVQDGDTVVTSGQLKLRNGNPVTISDQALPANEEKPEPTDE